MRGRIPTLRTSVSCGKRGFPKPPPDLSPDALAEWKRVGKLMGPQLVTALDVGVLRAYCEDVATYTAACAAIAKEGAVVKSPKGYPIENPWLWIQERAKKGILKSSQLLGLTPLARAKARPVDHATEDDSIESFMTGKIPRLKIAR